MIDPADRILRDLIQSRIPALAGMTQVDFEPPNEDWRQTVVAAGEERVNLYLYDLRENLKLYSNERTREVHPGYSVERQAPPRLDCHYVVTTWSPVTFAPPMVEPTLDEHARIYDVLAVLMRYNPLVPADVYRSGIAIPSGRSIANVPAPLQTELPVEVCLLDPLRNIGDFWNTMKVAWRPAIHLTVTVPVVDLRPDLEVPDVTTLIADHRQTGTTASEIILTIGGRAVAGADTHAVKGAWIELQGLTPASVVAIHQRMVTGAEGQFIFSRLPPGHYRLRAVAPGLGDIHRDVDLPSESPYDMQFP